MYAMIENQSPSKPESSSLSCLEILFIAGLWFWISFVIAVRYLVEIIASAISPDSAGAEFAYLPLVQFLLIAFPVFLLERFFRHPSFQRITRSWLWASLSILFLFPANLTSPADMQAQAFWHILGLCLFLSLIFWMSNRKAIRESGDRIKFQAPRDHWLPMILTLLALYALPWLLWGALGSLLDTLLQLLTALAFGLAAALWVEFTYLQIPPLRGNSGLKYLLAGSLVLITGLVIMVSAFGFSFSVIQVSLSLVLVPIAVLWTFLIHQPPSDASVSPRLVRLWESAILLAGAIAFPLLFFDPDELALIITLAPGETLQWLALASGVAILIGAFLTLLIIILNTRLKSSSKLFWIFSGGIALLVFIIYLSLGQVGFYGERMMVLLSTSADLSTPEEISDANLKRSLVYQRLTEHAQTSQESLRTLFQSIGIHYTPFYLVNGIEIAQNPLLKLWLETRDDVNQVIPSPRLRPLPAIPTPSRGSEQLPSSPTWNLTQIQADQVWKEFGITGNGVVIGNSDSGVDWRHAELIETYRGKMGDHTYNWLDSWSQAPEPFDINGHGTHTLGTIVGEHTGVAPGATWIACANLARNLGNPAHYLNCLQFMLAPFPTGADPFTQGKPELGAMVLNNSWGCPNLEGCNPASLKNAVEALRAAGIFVVASAGNEGPGCATVTDPIAIYDAVTTVGATDRMGNLAIFSSRGPVTVDGSQRVKPDLVAPGVDILSTFPGNSYSIQSGTSMAGPHVAAVVALIWSANPALIGDIDRTEQILFDTVQPYSGDLTACPGSEGKPSTSVGFGLINAYEAVKMAISQRK